jgi:hypothetical protein
VALEEVTQKSGLLDGVRTTRENSESGLVREKSLGIDSSFGVERDSNKLKFNLEL